MNPLRLLLSNNQSAASDRLQPRLSCWRLAAQLLLVLTCSSGLATAQSSGGFNYSGTSGGFNFSVKSGNATTSGNATITGYTGAGGSVVIPASFGGYEVTAIEDSAFQYESTITSVTIPNSVTSIGSSAFRNCSGLTSLAIPNSVTSIGQYAFYFCSGLTNIVFKGKPPTLGTGVFNFVTATVSYPSAPTGWDSTYGGLLTVADYSDVWTWTTTDNSYVTITGYTGAGGAVVIPASIGGVAVTAIGDSAFLDCGGLTNVTIPDSVNDIGNRAFSGCSGLTRVMIPAATVLGIESFPSSNTIRRYFSDEQLADRDNVQNGAGRKAGRADGQADVTSAPNTYGLYNLSQVQALNVGAPLLTRDAVSKKFKLTVKAKKSTDLVNFSDLPFVSGDSTINSNGEMEFQFTSPDNAAFFRIETH